MHAFAVAAALYVAHLCDGYVDAHLRGEEEPILPARANRLATAVASAGFLGSLAGLWVLVGPVAAAVTAPLWLLAVLHAPHLDRHPVAVTVDYPVGIAIAFLGGYVVQGGALDGGVLAVASLFVGALSATKVSVDRLDLAFDRSIGKRTVPVLLGDESAARVSSGLFALVAALVVAFVAAGTLPYRALAASAFPAFAAVAGRSPSAERAVRFQMALAYPFTAALVLSYCPAVDCVALRWLHRLGFDSIEQIAS